MKAHIRLYMGLLVFVILSSIFGADAYAQSDGIVVATWNIENLRVENDASSLTKDFDRLTELADQLDADIVALQEVDGPEAASQVFDPDKYQFFFSDRNHVQRTGFAVKNHLDVVRNPDFEALNVSGGLRHGTDITVMFENQPLRLLSVHLKSGCWSQDPLPSVNPPLQGDCEKLSAQVPVLEEWIDARAEEGVPFIVLGDFNRRFNEDDDTFLPEIDDSQPANADLVLVTEGRVSDCLNGRYPEYIDHILLDQLAAELLLADSFVQQPIEDDSADVMSDHCPIAVTLERTSGENGGTDEHIEHEITLMKALIDLLIAHLTELLEELHLLRGL